MTREGRIPCCVPFCRRTASAAKFPNSSEIICGKCGSLAKAKRRRLRRLQRIYSRRFCGNAPWDYPAGSPQRLEAVRLNRLIDTAWVSLKRAAIEAAGGI